MQFSDTTNKSGIIQSCEDWCGFGDAGISGQATLLKQFTAKTNLSLHKIWAIIFQSYGGWIYDDSNNTDLPQATTNLVAAQRRYALPSYALSVLRVEVTDAGGAVRQLKPLPLERVPGAVPEFLNNDGLPEFYRLTDGAIEIFPASNVNVTDGMELYFERASVEFSSSDTTKTPGFASPFHYLVAKGATIDWMKSKQADSPALKEFKEEWAEGMLQIERYYNKRWRELQPRITAGAYDWS